ncbi:unnamed protein product, partial [Pylaiella littoralis]
TGRKRKAGGNGKANYQRKETAGEKKKGKGKGKLLPPGAAAGHVFKCPKKLRGGRTKGCGAVNAEATQRCCECNLRFWEEFVLDGVPVKVRLGDETTWLEAPHLARPGEKKLQSGHVHSLDDLYGAGVVMACCTYKNHRGYLSAPIGLKDLMLVPPPAENRPAAKASPVASHGGCASAGSSDADGARDVAVLSLSGATSSSSSSSSSSAAVAAAAAAAAASRDRAAATGKRSVQSWGQGKCEHVVSEKRPNHKNGKCLGCHKAGKQAETGKTAPFCDDDRMGQGEEEAEDEDEEKKRRNLEDMTVQCETPGCDNGRFQLGVCCSCFARHRERIAKIATAAKERQENLPACRTCEWLLEDSEHAERMREANAMEGLPAERMDFSITGRCSECERSGGRGPHNPLLLCDGMGCPNSTHYRCLEPELTQLPRGLWFCDSCVRDKNREVSLEGCTACSSTFDDEKILLCDGSGCNALHHYDCLPVPLDAPPEGDWFCPRCAHGATSSSAQGSATGDGSTAGGGGGGGSSSGEKRKRENSGGGGGGTGGHGSSVKRAGKEPWRRGGGSGSSSSSSSSSNSAGKNSGSSSADTVSPPLDLCAHRGCLQQRNSGLVGVSAGAAAGLEALVGAGAAARAGTVWVGRDDQGGGGGAAAIAGVGGRDILEVLAEKEAEESRWQCKSRQCQGSIGSYHKRCLETRRPLVSVSTGEDEAAAGGNIAARPPPSEGPAREEGLEPVEETVCASAPAGIRGGSGKSGGGSDSGSDSGSSSDDERSGACSKVAAGTEDVEGGQRGKSGSGRGSGSEKELPAGIRQEMEAVVAQGGGGVEKDRKKVAPAVDVVEKPAAAAAAAVVVTVVAATVAVVTGIQVVAAAGPLPVEATGAAAAACVSDMDVMVLPSPATAAESAAEKNEGTREWELDFVCPACHSIVATHKEAAEARRG